MCKLCGKVIEGRGHAGFCNRLCYDKERYKRLEQVVKECTCGKVYKGSVKRNVLCTSCHSAIAVLNLEGSRNHAWRGGH